jgi:hypothetical protein
MILVTPPKTITTTGRKRELRKGSGSGSDDRVRKCCAEGTGIDILDEEVVIVDTDEADMEGIEEGIEEEEEGFSSALSVE